MRLLVVTQTVDAGNPALGFFVGWLRAFARRCDAVDVICLFEGGHDLPEKVRIHAIGRRGEAPSALRLFRYWKLLRRLLPRADRVFLHMCPEYAVAGAPFFLVTKKPVLLWFTHASVTWRLRAAERVVGAICTATDESLRLRTGKKRVLGHGIDASRFAVPRHAVPGRLRLLAVGRVSPVKGLETLVSAAVRLRARGLPAILDIVGEASRPEDADYRRRLDALIAAEGLGEAVRFLGAASYAEMPDIYAGRDILVHDSRTGGLDKVVLEALAAGMPVASSSAAAGFLPDDLRFPPGDHEALAERVAALAERLAAGTWDAGRWRRYVEEHHGLDRLADLLIGMKV